MSIKDQVRNMEARGIGGDELIEFEFQQNQGEMTEQNNSPALDEFPTSPSDTPAEPAAALPEPAKTTGTKRRRAPAKAKKRPSSKARKRTAAKTTKKAAKKGTRKAAKKGTRKAAKKGTRKAAKKGTRKAAKKGTRKAAKAGGRQTGAKGTKKSAARKRSSRKR